MNKPSRLILAPSDKLIKPLLSSSSATLVYLADEVCILESASFTLVQSLQLSRPSWVRIFENYHLNTIGEEKAQGILVSAFFDWLAARYNDAIVPSRNLACYEDLYEIAGRLRGAAGAAAILDVGCGPGTILRSQVAQAARVLVGFDISEVSANAAASQGMAVMSRDEFLAGPARFDVALSAYTMHYACDLTETLTGIQRNLKSGGVWALNFHKDIGLDAFFTRLGSTTLNLTTHVRDAAYGSIVAVTKR